MEVRSVTKKERSPSTVQVSPERTSQRRYSAKRETMAVVGDSH
jgi:hypothetical protein